MALRADVTNSAEIRQAVDAILARWDRIDILVNNAGGFAVLRLTEEIAVDEWQAILASNLTSVFLCSKAVLPMMKRQRYGHTHRDSCVGRGPWWRGPSHLSLRGGESGRHSRVTWRWRSGQTASR
jgi:NAD(P)-dependent dehydrogenase (short-subunit alcohol dehydrogenase family)